MTTLPQTSTTITTESLLPRPLVRKQRDKTAQKQSKPGKSLNKKQKREPFIHPVRISEVTENGFRVQVLNRDYYLDRSRYPYFSDATEEEIRDVSFMGYETHGRLYWEALELGFDLWQLDNPDKSYLLGNAVRGVPRPDLFTNHTIPLLDEA